ncbi:hypothetical protein GH714_016127 [Hevea brasiliensis]|uniref:Uncharacterized protein n=1 Tax=Hevea brasiliensis TaxID=3981 RepID=A0A6A6K6H2_HEVBR|nr:hypothetical protein GH714_016127 [Hevea brasiliensis]
MNILDERERSLIAAEKDSELRRALLQQEKEEINKIKLEFQESLNSLEDKKKQIDCAKEKLETMACETNELSVLEMKLKEEVDMVRAQKFELMAEEDRLKVEKATFETEWELIDEKREELRMEAEHIVEVRQAVCRLLKDEWDSLILEKETIREQHKRDVESLNHEREEFMNKMEYEHLVWFNKIQKEHTDFLLGIEMQKRELENSIEKRREEIESYLRDQEKAFEIEKKIELQHIVSLKEKAAKELEQVRFELKKLDSERTVINLEKSLISNNDDAILASAGKLDSSNGYHGQKLKSIESSGNRQPMRYAIGEPEVTPEPPEDETAKGKRDKESETKKDANEEIAPSFSEQARPAGRKRRVKNSPLDVSTDPQPEQRQNNKRRRQQKGAAVNLSISKDANNPSVTSTKINAPEDQHLTEGAEDADVVIAERIIKISEASEVTCDYCDVQDGGTNGNSNEKCVERSVVPCSSEVSVMLKDQMGHVGQGTDQHQSHEDASKTSDLRVEDSAVARSDNSEKVATCWRYWKEDKIKTEVIQF